MSLDNGGIEQLEATLEETFHEEDEVHTAAEPISKVFLEEYKEINKDKSPILFDLFQGKESIPARLLNALFCELQNVLKKNDSSVDFTYANGKPGRAVILTKVKTQASFLEYAWKLKWIDSMLQHIAMDESDLDDAAEWLCYYIGKKYDSSFTLASESLGYPLVQQMDEAATEAMWSDANVNTLQQRIIKRHLH
jgi:hypothetical protein